MTGTTMPPTFTARVFWILFLAPASLSFADAIIITKAMTASTVAEIFIEESAVRIELEIGGRDLEGFRNLMPDEVYQRLGHGEEPWAGRLARFFAEDLTLRVDDGSPLPGRLLEIAPRPRLARDEITGEPVPAPTSEEPLLGVPIAAGVLYPVFGLLLSPMIAAAAMGFSSVCVIGNALRLRNVSL